MSDILKFPSHKALRNNLPVEACFNQAKILNLKEVTIAGYTEDGNFFFSASENVTNESTLWLLELSKRNLFDE